MDIKEVAKELILLLDVQRVKTSLEERFVYCTDTTLYAGLPDLVVQPESEEEIIAIVKISKKYQIPLIPRGAGTGKSGGVVALTGGIVIDLERYNQIIAINKYQKWIRVQSGVTTHEIAMAANQEGFYYPPDPSSYKVSTIGGNLAENAGGLHCLKYGITSNYVAAFHYVDSQGKLHKVNFLDPNFNYSAEKILIGSEGTLGIITEIVLKIIEKPLFKHTYLLGFTNLNECIQAFTSIKKGGISPSVMEFLDKTTIEVIREYKNLEISNTTSNLILMEIDSYNLVEIESEKYRLSEIFKTLNLSDLKSASSPKDIETIWDIRRSISPSLKLLAPNKISEDICVPTTMFPQFFNQLDIISRKYKLVILAYGHIGDGNLHVNILFDSKFTKQTSLSKLAVEDIFKLAIKLKGTITGEHGVGLSKKRFLNFQYGASEILLMKKIKKAFDQNNIFNPQKIISI